MKEIILFIATILAATLNMSAESDADITWLNYTESTTFKSLNLKFGIKAKSKIIDFEVIVNNESIKGLNAVVNDGYDMVKSKSVILNEGQNTIEIVVKTVNGITTSNKTIVMKAADIPIDNVIVVDDSDDYDFMTLFNSAMSGDSRSQYLLGRRYLIGTSEIDKDMFESSLWFRESAMGGNHDGEYEFACALLEARGVLKNVRLAIEYLILASDNNHPAAQFKLGSCYEMGQGVEKNLAKAKELYTKCPLPEAKKRLYTLGN